MGLRTKLAVLAVPALMAVMGPTNCDYFSTVVVPATDTTEPLVGTRFFFFGEEQIELSPIEYETHDPDASFVVYPFVYDTGGARRISVGHGITVHCVDGPGVALDFAPVVEQQAGQVGSAVKNGIYVQSVAMKFGDYVDECGDVDDVEAIEYGWAILGRDFAGNETYAPGGHVVFTP